MRHWIVTPEADAVKKWAGWATNYECNDEYRECKVAVGDRGGPLLHVFCRDCSDREPFLFRSGPDVRGGGQWQGSAELLGDLLADPGNLPEDVLRQVREAMNGMASGAFERTDARPAAASA
jgi:hypothetical protein